MAESKDSTSEDFWLFHDIEMSDLVALRKFIDPPIDVSTLEGIDELLDRLNHLIE